MIATTPIEDTGESLPGPSGEFPDPDEGADPVTAIVGGERPCAPEGAFDEELVRAVAARVVARSRDLASATNHFLLAEPGAGGTDVASLQRYGVYAMEVLINAMLAMGATRTGLKARIYGGASMRDGFRDIGAANALFARRFLRDNPELAAEIERKILVKLGIEQDTAEDPEDGSEAAEGAAGAERPDPGVELPAF